MRLKIAWTLSIGLPGLALSLLAWATPARFAPGPFPNFGAEGLDGAVADLVFADFNGGGRADVFVVMDRTAMPDGRETAHSDRLFLGDGNGGFVLSSANFDTLPARAGSSAAAADFDRDGWIDLVVAGASLYQGSGMPVRIEPSVVYRGLGQGAFGPAQILPLTHPVVQVEAADIDGDQDADLLLRQSDGTLRILRNLSNTGTLQWAEAQSLSYGSNDPRNRFAVGLMLGDDTAPDLALLIPTASANDAAGVVLLRNVGGASPFAFEQRIEQAAPLADLTSRDINGDGVDDLVVVSERAPLTLAASNTRVYLASASGWRESDVRFPATPLRRVAGGDVDGDGRSDLIFTRSRRGFNWAQTEGDTALLLIALNRADGFVPTAQCLGGAPFAPTRSLRLARIDSDAWLDIAVAAPTAPGEATGPGWWRNHVANVQAGCCPVELAAQWVETVPPAPEAPLGNAFPTLNAVEVGVYAGVRDLLLADNPTGARLRQRYAEFSAEIVALMASHPTLWRDFASTLSLWGEPLERVLAGQGASRIVSAEMIAAVDTVLQTLTQLGSAPLAAAIADERARMPPLPEFIGLDLNAFVAAVLPSDRLFADSFEGSQP